VLNRATVGIGFAGLLISSGMLIGCQAKLTDKEVAAGLADQFRKREQSPLTCVWLVNRSGRVIDRCEMAYHSTEKPRPGIAGWRSLAGPFGPVPERIPLERWPGPIHLESVILISEGDRTEHQLNFESEPGRDVLIEIDEWGAIRAMYKQ
jgi:hypothetical protein